MLRKRSTQIENLAVVVHVFQNSQNLVISHVVVLQSTAKKCTRIENARAELSFCSLNLLFGEILVHVAVVVCLTIFHNEKNRWNDSQRKAQWLINNLLFPGVRRDMRTEFTGSCLRLGRRQRWSFACFDKICPSPIKFALVFKTQFALLCNNWHVNDEI